MPQATLIPREGFGVSEMPLATLVPREGFEGSLTPHATFVPRDGFDLAQAPTRQRYVSSPPAVKKKMKRVQGLGFRV